MLYKGVIFDLDGTLVDSIGDLADSLNTVLEKHQLPTHDLITYKQLIGNGIKRLVHDALPINQRSIEKQQTCVQEMFAIYDTNCLNKTKPYDGIVELLDALDAKQIPYAILSNKADEFTKKMVKSLFPNRGFVCVEGVINDHEKKPNPIVALRICDHMGLKPNQMIFMGDSGVDMQTAKNAGMCAVGVTWGFKPKEELKQNGAQYSIEHPQELNKIINSN